MVLDDESWSLKSKVFNRKSIFNPKSPWISNTAVAQLLFKNDKKFQKHFPQYEIVENKLSEFFIFLNSGGVNSSFFHIKLNNFFLKILNIVDEILIFFLPNIFALNRTIVLKKLMKIENRNLLSTLLVIFLIIFSITFNQYYGYIGILPIDSFLVFNSGYDVLNGYYPFKDYWTIKEPFIDLIQAIFFKLFGVSWFSYVLHASIFNCLITIFTFFLLKTLNLKNGLSFFYSICVAILTYPTAGTPFSDHHTLILCVLALYSFILAINNKNNIFWFLIPVLLGFSFFSKQAPTVYVIFLITILSIIFFLKSKNISNFMYAFTGVITILFLLFVLLFLGGIKFNDFLIQYFSYPMSLGGSRFEWLFPFDFKRIFWRYKLQYLSILVLIYLFIKFSFEKKERNSQIT